MNPQSVLQNATAWLQHIYSVLQPLVRAMFDTVANIFANKPEPARDVVVSVAALAGLAILVPRILKKVAK